MGKCKCERRIVAWINGPTTTTPQHRKTRPARSDATTQWRSAVTVIQKTWHVHLHKAAVRSCAECYYAWLRDQTHSVSPPPILEKGAFPKSQIGAAEASPVFHAILQSYNPPVFRRQFLCCGLFIFFICSSFLAKSVTPWFAQCHGNQTPMCMKMRLLWSVCLEFVGPMDPYLIRVCVHVWASLFA